MRSDVFEYLNSQVELKKFVREQPLWYRKLSRNPYDLQALEIESLNYYKKTIPHRVEKFSNNVQMASMMFYMLQSMKGQK